MTNNKLTSALEELRAAAKLAGEGSVRAFDIAIASVAAQQDPTYIGPLLLLLDDNADYEESMFSLIHAAEAFDDETYVHAFLEVLPQLQASAPKWASIVLMRTLNNDGTRATVVRAVRGSDSSVKQAVKWLCEKINERSPKFTAKTLPVLVAADERGTAV